MLCADSVSPCEPWEGVWTQGVSVSCLPDCLASIGCPSIRVTGATSGHCDGEYRLDDTVSYLFPRYTHVSRDTHVFMDHLNDKRWKIGRPGNWKIHSATGETSDLSPWNNLDLKVFMGFKVDLVYLGFVSMTFIYL